MAPIKPMTEEEWRAHLGSREELRWSGHSQTEYLAEGRNKVVVLVVVLGLFLLFYALHFHSAGQACAAFPVRNCGVVYYFAWPGVVFFAWLGFRIFYVAYAHQKGWMLFNYAVTNARVLKRTFAPHLVFGPTLQAAHIAGLTFNDRDTGLLFLSKKRMVLAFGGLPYGDVILAREAFKSAKSELSQ